MSDEDRQKWNRRYAEQSAESMSPHPWLPQIRSQLPQTGSFLDAGGGPGRNAIWAAEQGLTATVADISHQGLALAKQNAADAGVEINTWCVDLKEDAPDRQWDVLLTCNYLQLSLLDAMPQWIVPGGFLVMIQPTYTNLERHAKPPIGFVTSVEEVESRLSDCRVLHLGAEWNETGRHELRLLVQRNT